MASRQRWSRERDPRQCPRVKLFAGGPAVHYSGDVVRERRRSSTLSSMVTVRRPSSSWPATRRGSGRWRGYPTWSTVDAAAGPPRVQPDRPGRCRGPDYRTGRLPGGQGGSGDQAVLHRREPRLPDALRLLHQPGVLEGGDGEAHVAAGARPRSRALQRSTGSRAFRLAGHVQPPELVREICEGSSRRGSTVTLWSLFCTLRGPTRELLATAASEPVVSASSSAWSPAAAQS